MSRRFTEAERQRIADMRERGYSRARIARIMNCSVGGVASTCLKLGAEPPHVRPLKAVPTEPVVFMRGGVKIRLFTQAEDRVVLSLSLAGDGPTAIGRVLGRSQSSVGCRLKLLARREARAEAALETVKNRKTRGPVGRDLAPPVAHGAPHPSPAPNLQEASA